tara:strand:+ start:284 stop:697 length:414 start_codon:yes stop_codon:yes gene_type:complete
MKPTQEQILNALNKLVRENKTELKAEKIELGIAEDFKGILKASNNNFKNSEKMVSEASTINDIAFKILMKQVKLDETADEINKNADNLWKEFSRMAKELGINPKDAPAYKTYNEILSDLLSRSNEKSVLDVLKMRLN